MSPDDACRAAVAGQEGGRLDVVRVEGGGDLDLLHLPFLRYDATEGHPG